MPGTFVELLLLDIASKGLQIEQKVLDVRPQLTVHHPQAREPGSPYPKNPPFCAIDLEADFKSSLRKHDLMFFLVFLIAVAEAARAAANSGEELIPFLDEQLLLLDRLLENIIERIQDVHQRIQVNARHGTAWGTTPQRASWST